MAGQIKYILKGCLFALLLLIVAIIVNSLSFTSTQPSIVAVNNDITVSTVNAYQREVGKQLFYENCTACHHMRKTDNYLAGVINRVPDKILLRAWIRDSKSVLASGNKYFNALFKAYNETPMPAFPKLSDEQIDAIIEYMSDPR